MKLKTSFVRVAASLAIIVGFGASTFAPIANAEEVSIPLGQQGDSWNVDRPRTGITKTAVLNKYGEPSRRLGPVGAPPITTWEYPQFKVYFEYDHVIHSVVLR